MFFHVYLKKFQFCNPPKQFFPQYLFFKMSVQFIILKYTRTLRVSALTLPCMSRRRVSVTFIPPSPKSCSQFILTWESCPGRRMKDALRMMEWVGRGEAGVSPFSRFSVTTTYKNMKCQ